MFHDQPEQFILAWIFLLCQCAFRTLRHIVIGNRGKAGLKGRIEHIGAFIGHGAGRQIARPDQTEPVRNLHRANTGNIGRLTGMMLQNIIQSNQIRHGNRIDLINDDRPAFLQCLQYFFFNFLYNRAKAAVLIDIHAGIRLPSC